MFICRSSHASTIAACSMQYAGTFYLYMRYATQLDCAAIPTRNEMSACCTSVSAPLQYKHDRTSYLQSCQSRFRVTGVTPALIEQSVSNITHRIVLPIRQGYKTGANGRKLWEQVINSRNQFTTTRPRPSSTLQPW